MIDHVLATLASATPSPAPSDLTSSTIAPFAPGIVGALVGATSAWFFSLDLARRQGERARRARIQEQLLIINRALSTAVMACGVFVRVEDAPTPYAALLRDQRPPRFITLVARARGIKTYIDALHLAATATNELTLQVNRREHVVIDPLLKCLLALSTGAQAPWKTVESLQAITTAINRWAKGITNSRRASRELWAVAHRLTTEEQPT